MDRCRGEGNKCRPSKRTSNRMIRTVHAMLAVDWLLQLKYVRGVDISEAEVGEAARRFANEQQRYANYRNPPRGKYTL